MIYKNKLYLNLEDQVAYNKSKVEDLSTVTGLLGIKVVNQIEDIQDLPDDGSVGGTASEEFVALDYGDAYLYVPESEGAQYVFYVKTRANSLVNYDHWFDLVLEGLQGPIGPSGHISGATATIDNTGGTPTVGVTVSGPDNAREFAFDFKHLKGADGRTIVLQNTTPNKALYTEGDIWIDSDTFDVYRMSGVLFTKVWVLIGNIKGAKGDDGLQGPKGDPGGFIHLMGVVPTTDDLPDPITDLTEAYFVGSDPTPSNNPVWIPMGEDIASATWTSIGVLNLATYVTANGEFVGEWNSDTKLDKKTDNGDYVYTHLGASQSHQAFSGNATGDTIVLRTHGGQVRCNSPVTTVDAINLGYLETERADIDADIAAVESAALKKTGGTITGAINVAPSGTSDWKTILSTNGAWRLQTSSDTMAINGGSVMQLIANNKQVTINGINTQIYPNDPEMTIGTPYDKFGSIYLKHDVNSSHVYTNGIHVTNPGAAASDPSTVIWNSGPIVANNAKSVKMTHEGIGFDIPNTASSFLQAPWSSGASMNYAWTLPAKSGTLATTADADFANQIFTLMDQAGCQEDESYYMSLEMKDDHVNIYFYK